MSDEEKEVSEEEVEEEEEKQPPKVEEPKKEEPPPKEISEAELALEQKMKKKKEEEEQMWIEYMEQRKVQKIKEEEDLRKLKERQVKRKERRKEEEKKLLALRKQQEAQRIKEMEEKKAREAEAKKKRLEEAERKRQAMQEALQKNKMEEPVTPNFVITKRNEDGSIPATFNKIPTSLYIKSEMAKTKEQLAEDKKIALAVRVKPLELEGLQPPELKSKAQELWDAIVKLESEVYDLEEHRKRQEYDLKELSERQRQINRSKALKKGLDPDALSGKFPPMINVASKYERRLDRRNFGDKKSLFEGGYVSQIEQVTESEWENKMKSFKDRPSKLPKWDPNAVKTKEKPENTEPIEEEEDDLGPNPFLAGAGLENAQASGGEEKKEDKPEGENAEEEEGEEEEDEEEEEEEEE